MAVRTFLYEPACSYWLESSGGLFALAAHVLADQVCEATFGTLPKLLVVRGFLADHEASAVVARVEPFCGRGCDSDAAVEAHTCTHFDEGSALRKFCWFFVFDADQCDTLIVLEHAHGTDGHFVAGFGLPDGAPVAGGQNHQADHEHRREHNSGENDKGFSQL